MPTSDMAPAEQRPSARRALLGWLRVAAAAVLLYVLFRLVPLEAVAGALRTARLWPLALLTATVFCGIALSSLKLLLLVRTAVPEASWSTILRAYYVGAFFNNFLPTSAGGDVMKVREMVRSGVPVGHAAASVVVERGTGVLSVLALTAAVACFYGGLFQRLGLEAVRWPLAAAALAGLALPALLYPLWRAGAKPFLKGRRESNVWGRVYRIVESFYAFANQPRALVAAGALSVTFYALIVVNTLLYVHAVRGQIAPLEAAGIVPLKTLPEMLPISVGALGVREGAFTWCLAGVGVEAGRAAAAALLGRLILWLHSLAGGLLYAMGSPSQSGRASPETSTGEG